MTRKTKEQKHEEDVRRINKERSKILKSGQMRWCYEENRIFRLICPTPSPWGCSWDCWMVEDVLTGEFMRRINLAFHHEHEAVEMEVLAFAASDPKLKNLKKHPCPCGKYGPWDECCGKNKV